MKFIKFIFPLFIVLSILIVSNSCAKSDNGLPERIPFSYAVPDQVDDGWETAHLLDVGIDEDPIWEMMWDYFGYSSNNVHSVLIIKNNKLVFEKYFGGHDYAGVPPSYKGEWLNFDRDTLHCMHSTTKSFASALLGIAVDKGFVADVNDKIFKYFSEYIDLFDIEKKKISISHLLKMSSGLDWNEGDIPLDNPENHLRQILQTTDPIGFILEREVIYEPGTYYYYSGGDTNLVGDIVRRASGLNLDQFSAKYLFPQMGITNYYWTYFPRNPEIVYCSGDIYLRPRDMAKFGQLFLNKGKWNGEQLISEEWVKESTMKQIDQGRYQHYSDGYGYQWWLNTYHIDGIEVVSYSTRGWGGQTINVFPQLDSVVVFTGGNYNSTPPDHILLETYILPALIN